MEGLIVTPAPFVVVMALKRAMSEELIKTGIDFSGIDFEEFEKPEKLGKIIELLLAAATSKEVTRLLFECSLSAALNGSKITEALFEDPAMRKYYYPAMFEILKVNLSPFFEGLQFSFQGIKEKAAGLTAQSK